jgi:tRNA-dihydrouridine synthase
MGHTGAADWSWAARAREVVRIPVIVNGDVRSAPDARRAIDETGCAGVMVGRRAIEHPWVFREARALLDDGVEARPPTPEERIALCREHLIANVAQRGEPFGVHCTRRHLAGYLKGLPGAAGLRQALNGCDSLEGCLAILGGATARAA